MTARQHFCAHLMALAQRDGHIDDGAFVDCCYQAVSAYGFDPALLREALDIGPGSYERWIAGTNLPHPALRPKILLAIAHYLQSA